jgi:hypothetical protein
MTRILAWIAAGGLGGGIVLLVLAYSLGGRDLMREASWHGWPIETCSGSNNDGGGSERHWTWNGGDTVDLVAPGTVHFHAGEGDEVIARGSPELLSHLDIRGSRIVVRCWSPGGTHNIDITLPGRTFHRINITGSSRLAMDGLNQRELELRVSGSGEVEASGAVDRMRVTLSGSGNALLGGVAMKRLVAQIAGSGNIEAAPTELADIKIAGSGDVRLRSRPTKLSSHISGSGRITQAPPDPTDERK